MPQTKFQDFIYTIIMIIVMVYTMVTYNVVINVGASNKVFYMALGELPIMGIIGFIIEFFFIGKIVKRISFKIMDPNKDKKIFIILTISTLSVVFMCPIMSFIASILFNYNGVSNILINWLKLTVINFPMALCFQLFYAGPLVRFIFNKIFKIN